MRFLSTVRRGGRKLYSVSSGMHCTPEQQSFNRQYPLRSINSTIKLVTVTILSFVSSLALYAFPPLPRGRHDVESTWLSWALITVFCLIRQNTDVQYSGYQSLQVESPSFLDFAPGYPRKLLDKAFPFLAVTAGILSGTVAAKDCLVSISQRYGFPLLLI